MSSVLEPLKNWIFSLVESGHLPSLFGYSFIINALIASFIISPVLGGIGTMVVVKRMAFFSESIGHAALTGIAVGVLIGEPVSAPYVSLFSFCILFALVMNYTKNKTKMSTDTIIGVFLSISLAFGSAILLFVVSKVNVHILESVLFGSILTISDFDLLILLIIAIICSVVGVRLFNKSLLSSFNPALAKVRGINVKFLDYLFVLIVTLITVASVKIIGAVLVEALLLIPASSARNLAKSMKSFFFYSILFSFVSCVAGVILPMALDLTVPSGSAIILFAAVIFLISVVIKVVSKKFAGAE